MPEPPRFRVGNQTALSAQPLSAPFEFALAHGFDAFEWFPDRGLEGSGWSALDLSARDRWRIRSLARAHDISSSLHASLGCTPWDRVPNRALQDDLQLARDIGAALVVLHLDLSRGAAAFLGAIVPVAEHLAARGISLALENTVQATPQDFNRFFALLGHEAAGLTDRVGMCFDIGHANLCSATQNDYLAFLDQLAPQVPIIHVHLHENYGDADTHLTLFSGPAKEDTRGVLGLLARLGRRGFSGCMILEQWPQPPALLVDARARLMSLAGSHGARSPA